MNIICISNFKNSVLSYNRPEGNGEFPGPGQITQRKKALKMLKEYYESFSHREGK